jgi:hypothetical protein
MADETRKGPEKYQHCGQTIHAVIGEQASEQTIRAEQASEQTIRAMDFGPRSVEAQACRMTMQAAPNLETRQASGQTIHAANLAQSQPAQQPQQAPSHPAQPNQKK